MLALDFQKDWDVKKLLKRIVMSATYKQASDVSPELLKLDPMNRLYARGARFRLDAEVVRDQALAAAGLLSKKQFGAPVMPWQPDGVWLVVYNGEQAHTAWQTGPNFRYAGSHAAVRARQFRPPADRHRYPAFLFRRSVAHPTGAHPTGAHPTVAHLTRPCARPGVG